MYSTFSDNISGIVYYFYFQFAGLGLASLFFPRERLLSKLVIGSVTGSLLLTWLPILCAFLFGFTPQAHLLAFLVTLPILIQVIRRRRMLMKNLCHPGQELREHKIFLILLAFFLSFWIFLLYTHTILLGTDGAVYTGQSTYGDMNMHLGFLTSLARQGTFPPDYSIMPGVRLSYPFLSDSISSSLYLLGASLRLSYILPMVFAMAQIFCTMYLFALTLSDSRKKAGTARGAFLTLLLFFCNGGLGFAYFLGWTGQPYHFSDIFTEFYTTPTNLTEQNIRWVNVIADMFLPQRATLFGYAVLFPALWLLYRAVFQDRREFFPLAALFTTALPMIHTHSFLSAGIVSAVWMLLWLYRKIHPVRVWNLSENKASPSVLPTRNRQEDSYNLITRHGIRHPGAWIVTAFTILMCLLQLGVRKGSLSSAALMTTGICPFVLAAVWGLSLLVRYVRQFGWKKLAAGWGIYLICILTLALPQLLFWTFSQVSQGGFVRGHFNWGNQGDFYPWFYVKNIGAPLILILGGICTCGRKRVPIFLPVLFLWWLGELIVFTPNTYDNNKLLYVAYFLLCLGSAEYGVKLFDRIKKTGKHRIFAPVLAAIFLFLASFSGILTLGREAISRYQLYGTAQMALAEYVEENTPTDAVFLTSTRHNNEIASLTGRNIVCGTDTFLYFHGLDTRERRADLQAMYEKPLAHMDLFAKYNVSYVVISSYERNSYAVDESAFRQNFAEAFSYGDVTLYRIP